jgi:hypothetical protein
VIIGRLIPAGTGLPSYRSLELATPDGTPLIVEPAKRDEEKTPLLLDDDDEMPALGRTAGRPDPLPLDGFTEGEELAADVEGEADEGDDLGLRLPDMFSALTLGADDMEIDPSEDLDVDLPDLGLAEEEGEAEV